MITAQFLSDVTDYVDGRIAKVVLNGTVEITSFIVKEAPDRTVILQYIIPVADVSLVELIELRDDSGAILSSNPVEIPITSDTRMLQTVEIKEVMT
ncbi:ketopantoate hydroxymethyltransferase [Cohnella sp. LGH]|uniref:ketopantoate hydroxymethyltransferase n=1 Tax=Cohnella sp. LGH TaxID=1619153 RepID=UPI001ADC5CE7|nr:ketopantoate hydroxymethyltransferase [Cohnella sp. LGH]QTH44972.1 ketopantoate hydroxymethyltransferase [Cohnella sp. LGH]